MKILITSVSAGTGHTRAAEAIESALRLGHPGIEIVHINVLDYVIRPFRTLYESGYAFAANQHPGLWGFLYHITNRNLIHRVTQPLLNFLQRLFAGHFLRFVERYAPDKIVTTHFLAPQLLSSSLRNQRTPPTLECVITDYGLHRFWVDPSIDRYYVAHAGLAAEMARAGVTAERVVVSGIPIDPLFLKSVSMERVRHAMGLNAKVPTLLMLSGGMGFGALDQTVQALFALKGPLQIIAVAGKNETLHHKLLSLQPPAGFQLFPLGYVTNMHELLSVSDLVVSKAGGLTVSEGLAKGTPMIFYGALPGQEDKNVDYVVSSGAGLLADSRDDLVRKIGELIADPNKLKTMKSHAHAAARPKAALDIADSLPTGEG